MKKDEEEVKFPPEIVPVSIINGIILARHELDSGFLMFLRVSAIYIFFQVFIFCVAYAVVSLSSADGKEKINRYKLFCLSFVAAIMLLVFVLWFTGEW